MEWKVDVNNTSFERVGITRDCREAICEYIWNGFEAGATTVEVKTVGSPFKEAMAIQVVDNGKGIDYENLKETFKAFLSSVKNSTSIRIKSQTNKGKGRFSYLCFSSNASWSTVYKNDGVMKSYSISMDSANRSNFFTTDIIDVTDAENTGTTVEFPIVENNTVDLLSFSNMQQKLLQEFSWFLYLNKSRNLSLEYMGITLDYNQYIRTDLSVESSIDIEGEHFKINLIVWQKNIDNASKVFYLAENGDIHAADNTGFNKNTVDFFHNVFVSSPYINSHNVSCLKNSGSSDQISFESQDDQKRILGQLRQEIKSLIAKVFNTFLIQQADQRLVDMEENGSMPVFPQDEYGQLRKKDFETVTRELYCVEPKIFYKLNDKQEKTLLGFMNLLLSSDERENVLSIVEHVVSLTADQRNNFADILQRTKLQYILDAICTIDKRLSVVEQLKRIVYDLAKFSNERDHIQKIVEQHFWLFGEQYHLLTSDKTLATSLAEFENITNVLPQEQAMTKGKKKTKAAKSENGFNQRADIFLYTQRTQEDSSNERLIVELKAPSVKLSLDVYNQIVRYANTIRKEPRFNGMNRFWRFYAVCATVEDDVKVNYENFKQYGKHGLVNIIDNFEIYALSWDDVFQSFEARHSTLLDKLKLDYTQTAYSLGISEDQSPSRDLANEISRKIIELQVR